MQDNRSLRFHISIFAALLVGVALPCSAWAGSPPKKKSASTPTPTPTPTLAPWDSKPLEKPEPKEDAEIGRPSPRFGGRTGSRDLLNELYPHYTDRQLFVKATQLSDRIRRKIEEWGMVTVSTPVIMPMNERFSLGKDEDFPKFKDYLTKAESSVQGSVAQFSQSAFSNSLGAQFSPTVLPIPAVPAAGGAAASTTTTTSSSAKPSDFSDAGTGVTAPANTLLDSFASKQFAPAGTLLNIKPTGLSERQALMIAGNDMAAQGMIREMASPHDENDDVFINFAMVEVSCNPGWRTKESYLADCTAYCEYWNPCTHQAMALNERDQPLVYSVLPLLDAQTLDLANSERQLTSLAAQLSAAFPVHGVDIKAKDLIQFAKSFQRDAASRTAIPVVNSYSSGRTFGFRFSPSFRALKDPAVRKSGTANVLTPTSFPALVTIVLRKNTVFALGKMLSAENKGDPRIQPQIITHISTRWLLADRPKAYQVLRWLSWPALKREDSEMRMDLARDTKEMYRILDWLTSVHEERLRQCMVSDEKGGSRSMAYKKETDLDPTFDYELEELRRNVIELEAKGIGQSHPFDFFKDKQKDPPDKSPAIVAIAPSTLVDGQPATLAIAGKNFTDNIQVFVGGHEVKTSHIYASSLLSVDLAQWPVGTITIDKKQIVPVIITTPNGTTVDTTHLVLKTDDSGGGDGGGTGDTGGSKGAKGSKGTDNSNAVTVALGEGLTLSKLTVESAPKPATPPAINPDPPKDIKFTAAVADPDPLKAKPASLDITVTGSGLDTVGGAKLMKDKADLIGIGATTVISGSATKLTVHVEVSDDFLKAGDQTATVALFKTAKPADSDKPLVTSKPTAALPKR
ncbi:MAG: hypothetical protein ACAI37_07955 [Chthoniobacter sp.]